MGNSRFECEDWSKPLVAPTKKKELRYGGIKVYRRDLYDSLDGLAEHHKLGSSIPIPGLLISGKNILTDVYRTARSLGYTVYQIPDHGQLPTNVLDPMSIIIHEEELENAYDMLPDDFILNRLTRIYITDDTEEFEEEII
jgi:hypothetical protein